MSGGRWILAAWLTLAAWLPTSSRATGFSDIGYDVLASTDTRFDFGGALRLRSALLHNLDLDRGLTPSGETLFPVSLSEPARQNLAERIGRARRRRTFSWS